MEPQSPDKVKHGSLNSITETDEDASVKGTDPKRSDHNIEEKEV